MISWEFVSLQSRVNNSGYGGDSLATQNWAWPQETWFQKRLAQLRKKRRQTAAQPQPLQTQLSCASTSVQVNEWS
jgi:hypothetical protein